MVMVGDKRECAKAVNAMMKKASQVDADRYSKAIAEEDRHRIKQVRETWWFAHHDSRGGDTFIDAPNVIKAIERYRDEVLQPEEIDDWVTNEAATELMNDNQSLVVLVLDEEPGEGEMLADYNYAEWQDAKHCARIIRTIYPKNEHSEELITQTSMVVLWAHGQPEPKLTQDQDWRHHSLWEKEGQSHETEGDDFGEDAWGLIWQ
jgi:hypothetical protein